MEWEGMRCDGVIGYVTVSVIVKLYYGVGGEGGRWWGCIYGGGGIYYK